MNSLLIISLLVGTVLADSSPPLDKRVYTFGIGMDSRPFEFITEDGDVMGFSKDIVREVCDKAGKKCVFVSFKDYNVCWNSQTMSAEGLNNKFWDVCCTYYKTKDRALVYGFFGEYSAEEPAFLYARKDAPFEIFDPSTYRTGFRKGFWLSEQCLKQNHNMDVQHSQILNNWEELINGLNSNNIDVAFITEGAVKSTDNLKKISKQLNCALTGNSLMVRKDALGDFSWFEPVLKQVMNSSYYPRFCYIAKKAYGGDPFCMKK